MAKKSGKGREELAARLRYEFDKSMSAGPIALIGWLAVLSVILIAIAALVLAVTGIAPDGGERLGFVEAMWASLMRTLDAGTMGGDVGWGFRIIMLLVTIAGIFVVSTLIGLLSSGIEGKLEELRKGRSKVLESDHTIILNWSPSIFDIISELSIANLSRKHPRIVVMANMDKVEMEDEIAAKVPDLRNTRVICRSGDPTDLYDLALVSPQTSRSIIVLSPETEDVERNDPDSQVVKTILALVNDPARREAPYRIAAEVQDGKNAELARTVGGSEVQLVLADDLIARIVVHSSRQSGLSAVYSELLDFEGSEIYTLDQPELAGNSFGDALMAFESSTLIGMCDVNGRVYLNPPMDTQFQPGLKAIIIAEDDAAIKITTTGITVDTAAVAAPRHVEKHAERTLMLGWNHRGPIIAFELSRYVAPGSLLTIAADAPGLEDEVAAMQLPGGNLHIEFGVIDTTHRPTLEELNIPSYDHVLVLGYSDHMEPQPTDTRTLVTLLHLRKIAEASGRHINVVSEMIDVRNRELAEVTRADDFVVSNKLVSLMLAQASENENLSAIFEDLLDEEGSEIYMRPVEHYIELGRPVNFYTVAEACRQRGEVAIGYARRREGVTDARNMGGVVVNPKKSEALLYAHGDRFVILARD
ncbi:MAG: CASTOR/POLLUX-related putative ion channel [Devosia sp.]